jgi:cytochrome c peroxidase
MKSLLGLLSAATAIAVGPAAQEIVERPAGLPQPVADADYYDGGIVTPDKVELGRVLFFDKILSGNKNIACATCHHPETGTSDFLALGLGEGPTGLGPDRQAGTDKATAVHGRVPRNSPALFNLGAQEFERLFHDGRVESDPNGYFEGGFVTPAKWKLPKGLDNVLAAQAMFPVASPLEMAGQKGENPIADQSSLNNVAGKGGVWQLLASRLQAIPQYVERFRAAYPDQVQQAGDINYVLAANAIAAFEAQAFRADDSPYDRYLRGDSSAMGHEVQRGMALFYGKAGCSGCHSGAFQTDHEFYAIAMPQIGPGKADGRDAGYWNVTGEQVFLEDFGRGRVTVRPEDQFKFRTPSLRNVELTGPWGHDGAYDSLEDVVRHHLDPVASLEAYQCEDEDLPTLKRALELNATGSRLSAEWLSKRRMEGFLLRDSWVQEDSTLRGRIAEANELQPVALTDGEVDDLLAFLKGLTDPASRDLADVVPNRVPSGLPVED